MRFILRALAGGSLVVWVSALLFSAEAAVAPRQATTNDGLYTKVQAENGGKQFQKICASCHPFTVAAKKRPQDIPLGDVPFLENWGGRPLTEMVTVITLTMPNDGSAVVEESEALDLVAYILQRNGYPAGPRPLTKATASAVVVKPKK